MKIIFSKILILRYGTPLLTTDGTVKITYIGSSVIIQQTLNAYILAYDHTWGKHTLNLLAGYEQYANTVENLQARCL